MAPSRLLGWVAAVEATGRRLVVHGCKMQHHTVIIISWCRSTYHIRVSRAGLAAPAKIPLHVTATWYNTYIDMIVICTMVPSS